MTRKLIRGCALVASMWIAFANPASFVFAQDAKLIATANAMKAFQEKDFSKFMSLSEDADRSHKIIQFGLGYCYYYGEGCSVDFDKSFYWLKQSAENGYANAQYMLGEAYLHGRGVDEDWDKAKYWMNKSKANGFELAASTLAKIEKAERVADLLSVMSFLNGLSKHDSDDPTDKALKAFNDEDWALGYKLSKDADKSNREIQFYLGVCCENGYGCAKNLSEAAQWYLKSARQGCAEAQYNLGNMYVSGKGVKRDLEEGLRWWKKVKEGGYDKVSDAIADLATCLALEAFENSQYAKGLELAADADQDDADILYYLGVCHKNALGGCGRNLAKAADNFLRAAREGSVEAQLQYAQCCEEGDGVEKDLDIALGWYRSAAQGGSKEALIAIERVNTARALREFGAGRLSDGVEIALSTKCDNPFVQYFVGKCFMEGTGVQRNAETAAGWYQKSALRGCVGAQYEYAKCLFSGIGVEADLKAAFSWFERAAKAGDVDAMVKCAQACESGKGVARDDNAAEDWYRKAKSKGSAYAAKQVVRLATERAKKAFSEGRMDVGYRLLDECDSEDGEIQYRKAALLLSSNDAAKLDSAAEWCEKAVGQCHPEANNLMAEINTARAKMAFKAQKWERALELCKTANQNDAEIIYWRAHCLEDGDGCRQNLDDALKLYKDALSKGFAEAEDGVRRTSAEIASKPAMLREALAYFEFYPRKLYSQDKIVHVPVGADINAAIRNCPDGGTLVLGEGVYEPRNYNRNAGLAILDKSIRITGASPDKTVVKGFIFIGGEDGVSSKCCLENLTLVNFLKKGSFDQVTRLSISERCTCFVDNCRLQGAGVTLHNNSRVLMYNSTIADAEVFGLKLGKDREAIVLSTTVKDSELDSIVVSGTGSLYCHDTTIDGCPDTGIVLLSGGRLYMRDCSILNVEKGFFDFSGGEFPPHGVGIAVGSWSYCCLDNVAFKDCSHGAIFAETVVTCYNITTEDCGKQSSKYVNVSDKPNNLSISDFFGKFAEQ